MKLQVLGCSAIEWASARMTSFLLDDKLLLDAGTVAASIDESVKSKIRNILLTHSHLDHIKDLPFIADYIVNSNSSQRIVVFSISEVIESLRQHLFNDILWPDFTRIPSDTDPIVSLRTITPGVPFVVDEYEITAYRVNHSAPAVGYLIEDGKGKRLLYMGDSGPNSSLWGSLNGTKLQGVIIEASMPDSLKELALKSGHLTPELLVREIEKIGVTPDNVFVTHAKPIHRDIIREELSDLNIDNMRILEDGQVYEI